MSPTKLQNFASKPGQNRIVGEVQLHFQFAEGDDYIDSLSRLMVLLLVSFFTNSQLRRTTTDIIITAVESIITYAAVAVVVVVRR